MKENESSVYTEIILSLYKDPPNKGTLKDPDVLASGGNPTCGDQAAFYLKIRNDKIEDIKFYGTGCAISVASEALLSEMVKGKRVSEAQKVTQEQLFAELGNIIQTRIKCATLGLLVLKRGLAEYQKTGGKKTIVKGIIV